MKEVKFMMNINISITSDNTNLPDVDLNELFPMEITPFELLGHAKNNIVEVQKKLSSLPQEYICGLRLSYRLLETVQKYLMSEA